MSIVSTTKMTSRQFLLLGQDPPGLRLELVDGEIAVSPSPKPSHSRIEKMLSYLLLDHIIKEDLGELFGDVDTIFGDHGVRRPDIVFYKKSRVHLIDPGEALEAPPDLCIEIISSSSEKIDRKDKFKQYAAGQVPYYWILDPKKRTLEGYRLTAGSYRLVAKASGSESIALPPLPKLHIPLGDLWFPARS